MNAPAAIALGCSAGGVDALKAVLGGLDAALRQTILVCCHSSSDTVDLLCEVLGRVSPLPVVEAKERHVVRAGAVHLAPSGYHLLVEGDLHFALSVDPRVNHARPSIDVMFTSAAEVWQNALIGVVLTGGNADGAKGLRRIRELGGTAIVQSPDDAEAPTMPRAALEIAGTDYCVALNDIAPLLNRLCLV
ncbi:chemotaxis protein CheB [Dyella psychrodurans]|uniref:protein-glutamate methylesterase n=1 Tax=Dyella psychrodurans TaxID=1927960 RepID=A0A370X4V5_9GAMM|nr:chemotaxis protein CheB [Dyella psychrodurans]RDS83454.1 chemotaxis protein CheB [Dyella psychrodurans]